MAWRVPLDPGRVPSFARRLRPPPGPQAEAFETYLALCSDYVRRQVIVYTNWPQRRWDATGYRDEKVFTDRNA